LLEILPAQNFPPNGIFSRAWPTDRRRNQACRMHSVGLMIYDVDRMHTVAKWQSHKNSVYCMHCSLTLMVWRYSLHIGVGYKSIECMSLAL